MASMILLSVTSLGRTCQSTIFWRAVEKPDIDGPQQRADMAAESAQDRALVRSIFGTRFGKTQHRTGRRGPCSAPRVAGLLEARVLEVRRPIRSSPRAAR